MKKKITFTLSALVCAFCCMFSLTACGDKDDDADKKYHSAAQWTAAFSDPSVTDCYSFCEFLYPNGGEIGGQTLSLAYDKNSEYYSLSRYEITIEGESVSYSDSTTETAYKAGAYYYKQESGDGSDYRTYEITSAEFASKITGNSFADTAQSLLDYCKNGYEKFAAYGTSSWNDVKGRTYKANNVRVEVDETSAIVFEEVKVSLTDAGAVFTIEAAFFHGPDKHIYQYNNDNSATYASRERSAPTRLEGNTFKLVVVNVSNGEGSYYHDYDTWATGVVSANSDNTITAKADGTLEGDIVIDMGDGATLALNTMKFTQDFVHAATYANVTVSNEHIPGLTEAQKITLTGNLSQGFTESVWTLDNETLYNDTFRLTLIKDGKYFNFYFQLQNAAN